jgi:hypothetical protein
VAGGVFADNRRAEAKARVGWLGRASAAPSSASLAAARAARFVNILAADV